MNDFLGVNKSGSRDLGGGCQGPLTSLVLSNIFRGFLPVSMIPLPCPCRGSIRENDAKFSGSNFNQPPLLRLSCFFLSDEVN